MLQDSKNKFILGVVLAGTIVLTGWQTAGARPWGGGSHGWGAPPNNSCGAYGYSSSAGQRPDEESVEARDAFRAETAPLRKEIAVRRAEKIALMQNDNPDAKRISQLTGELFDLHEQLYSKAKEAGIEDVGLRGPGFGPGCNSPGIARFQKRL